MVATGYHPGRSWRLIGGCSRLFLGPRSAFWVDKLKLTIPVVKGMFRSLYISRSLQTMGQLINAGVPMLDTLAITGDISGNQLQGDVARCTRA
jgi:type II secretory pathway component PulF